MSSLKSRRRAPRTVPTKAAIRAATPFSKPQGEIAKVQNAQAGDLVGPLEPAERSMLRQIAETADLIGAG
jgi:hypothetical protein